jgi:hypothetical protein
VIYRIYWKGEEIPFLSEALSLQDVFSDSGNASGSSQKTSRLFKSEQGKEAQLKGKKNQNQSEIFLEAAENLS